MILLKELEQNINKIQQNIQRAALKSGRTSEDITLIGVTKTVPVDRIKKSLHYGITQIGENKAQELLSKYDELEKLIHFHFIGHLQSNKIKYIIDKVQLIHSVDSYNLAKKINKEAQKHSIVMNILLQVNIAQEEGKFGMTKEMLYQSLYPIAQLPYVCVKGLMAIPPYTEQPEKNRGYFQEMRKLFIDIKHKNIDNIHMEVLSMGMTNDYQVAIEEGATMIRIGSGIYGERIYTNAKEGK